MHVYHACRGKRGPAFGVVWGQRKTMRWGGGLMRQSIACGFRLRTYMRTSMMMATPEEGWTCWYDGKQPHP